MNGLLADGDAMDYVSDDFGAMPMGSVRCSMEVLSVRLFLPVECLGYGLVVPFLAYRLALWLRIMKI